MVAGVAGGAGGMGGGRAVNTYHCLKRYMYMSLHDGSNVQDVCFGSVILPVGVCLITFTALLQWLVWRLPHGGCASHITR